MADSFFAPVDRFVSVTRRFFMRGFSLLELIFVVIIIGILAAATIPTYHKTVDHRYCQAAQRLAGEALALQREHHIETGTYADYFKCPTGGCPAGTSSFTPEAIYPTPNATDPLHWVQPSGKDFDFPCGTSANCFHGKVERRNGTSKYVEIDQTGNIAVTWPNCS